MDMIWFDGHETPFVMDADEWSTWNNQIIPTAEAFKGTNLTWYTPYNIQLTDDYVYADVYIDEHFCYYVCIPREWWNKWQTI